MILAQTHTNVALYLPAMAQAAPDSRALVVAHRRRSDTRYRSYTYSELDARVNRFANALHRIGIRRGMRVLQMVRPGLNFVALTFALFKIGAAVVLIDAGMGVRKMLGCIAGVKPQALVGIRAAHLLRRMRPSAFKTIGINVSVGRGWGMGGHRLEALAADAQPTFDAVTSTAGEPAAILFTSGSTGVPKGVLYEHGMFAGQVEAIREHYGIQPTDIELATFPLFALFCPGLGMTCVLPDMDFTRPGAVDADHILQVIQDQQITNCFGSPALWKRVVQRGRVRGITLPTVRRVLIAGAPVPWRLLEGLQSLLSADAQIYTPYGATEALPVSSISGEVILSDTLEHTRQGGGICVGVPLPHVTVRIIDIIDNPIPEWSQVQVLPQGNIGEITVKGAVVTREYYQLPEHNRSAKIRDGEQIWHRMGDVGYFDDQGRLWFCGRKAHRVRSSAGTLFTVPCESIFNDHPQVSRSALVGVGCPGVQVPVIVIETSAGGVPRGRRARQLREDLLALAKSQELTSPIKHVLFHRGFPVDVRHNAKINREALSVWASRRIQ